MKQKLFTLLTLLLCVCSGAWSAVSYSGTAPATTTHLVGNETKTFLDVANTGTNAQIKNGAATFALGLQYIVSTSWASGTGTNSTSGTSTDDGFLPTASSSSYDAYTQAYGNVQIKSSQETVLYVTGITGFAVWGKDNDTKSDKQLIIKVAEIASNGTVGEESSTTNTANTSDHLTAYVGSTLNGLSYYRITLTTGSTSACATYQARFTPYVDPRDAAPISWSAASYTAVIGESNTYPTLSNEKDLTVTYSSSNTSVASFANPSNYAITLNAAGSTTISATYTTTGINDNYKTTKVSYELTVSNISAVSNKFWKFSDAAWSSYTQSASPQTIDNMYIISNSASDLPIQDCSASYSDESLSFTKQLYTSGSSTDARRILNIAVAPGSKISVYAAASGTGNRNLYISNGSYNNTSDQAIQATSSTTIFKLSHTNVAGGDVFIHNSNGYYIYGIKVEPLKCGTPSFSPNGGSIEEGGSVTITSEDATSIKYAWTADDVATPGSWTTVTATDNAITVTVPNETDNTPRLHAYGIATGYTDGDAAYVDFTITGVDNTAPTLSSQSVAANATNVAVAGDITLTFSENVQVADASKVTLTGGDATISSVTAEDNVVTIAYTGLAYNTTYTLAVASGAITDIAATPNAYAGTSFSFTTVKEPMHAPTISGLGYFIGSQTVSISSDVDGAVITYTLDGTNYSAYTEPFEISDSKTVIAKATHANYSGEGSTTLAMYQITVPDGQGDVTATTTWDFTDANDMKISSNATNNPIPDTQLLNAVTAYSENAKAARITFIKPQRYDAGGYVQAHGFVINTTAPGTLSVKFTNGNSNLRYLIVNGVKEGQISSSSSHINVNDIVIPVGTTIVYGFDVSDNAVNNLRYETITFTNVTSVSKTITSAGWATYCSPYALDFSSTIENLEAAYIVTGGTGGVLTKTAVTGTVPANTGLLLKGEGECVIPVVASSETNVSSNKLVGKTEEYSLAANSGYVLLNETTGEARGIGFYINESNAFTVGANTAYLPAGFDDSGDTAPSLFRIVEEENDATNISNLNSTDNAVKVIENGRILILRNGITYDALGRVISK